MPRTNSAHPGSRLSRIALSVLLLTAVLSAMLTAFALPALHLGAHDVPVLIAGPKATTTAVADSLQRQQPGAFRVIEASQEAAARKAILDRGAYGALVFDGTKLHVLTASAASPSVAQLIDTLGDRIGTSAGLDVFHNDLRPLPKDDPHGAGLTAGSLPLVLGGWAAALVMILLVHGTWQRLIGTFAFAAVGGLALTALEQFWFHSVDGNYLLTSAAVALGIAATSWAILGLRSAFGNLGLVIGAVLILFVGNPLSGLNSAPELLPRGWGTLGQLLPPGANGTLLRSAAFFDGHGALQPILVLCGWLAAGLALFFWGERRGYLARTHQA